MRERSAGPTGPSRVSFQIIVSLRVKAFLRLCHEGLTGQLRNAGKARARHLLMWSDIRIRRLPAIIDIGGSPNGVERSVQSKPGIDFPGELLWCRDNRFQRSAHIGIAMSLAAGKSAAIAAQEGKMRL